MIQGILKHDDISIRYDQTMNATENIIKEFLGDLIKKGKLTKKDLAYLIACMASAFSTEMEGLGYLQPKHYFTFPSPHKIQMQMDDAHFLIANDPRFEIHKGDVDSYFMDTWVRMAILLYDCPAYSVENPTFDMAVDLLCEHHGIQLCLKNPGHGIAPVDYDSILDVIRFHDSWAKRPGLTNGGIHEHLQRGDWYKIVPMMAVYPRKQ